MGYTFLLILLILLLDMHESGENESSFLQYAT